MISMTDMDVFADIFTAHAPAIVFETLGEKLRREGLEPLKKARDKALRSIPHDHDNPVQFYCQQQQQYWTQCHSLIKWCRPELHRIIDAMLDKAERGVQLEDEMLGKTLQTSPLTPTPTYKEPERSSNTPDDVGISSREAPVASMDFPNLGLASPAISAKRSTIEEPQQLPKHREAPSIQTLFAAVAGRPFAPSSGKKRPCPDATSPTQTDKRARRSKIGIIALSKVKKDECVFEYKQTNEFYVIRCNRRTCKEKAGEPLIYFRAHPFESSRAMKHFGGQGHGHKSEDEGFEKYGYKVDGATKERNTGTCETEQASNTTTDQAETPTSVPTPPRSPTPEQNLKMQPEEEYDDDSMFVPPFTHPEKPSGSCRAAPSLPTPPLREPTRNRKYPPHVSVQEISDSDNSDGDLPSLGRLARGLRCLKKPSYQDAKLAADEFE